MAVIAAAAEAEAGAAAASEESAAASSSSAEGGGRDILSEDSAKNAASNGVDVNAISSNIGPLVNLAIDVWNLTRSITHNKEDNIDFKRKRYLVGLLYHTENRDALVNKGEIPQYYSSTSIKDLINNHDKLPYGWGENTTVQQGFGKEVMAGVYRKRNLSKENRLVERLYLQRKLKESQDRLFHLQNRFKLNKTVEHLSNII